MRTGGVLEFHKSAHRCIVNFVRGSDVAANRIITEHNNSLVPEQSNATYVIAKPATDSVTVRSRLGNYYYIYLLLRYYS